MGWRTPSCREPAHEGGTVTVTAEQLKRLEYAFADLTCYTSIASPVRDVFWEIRNVISEIREEVERP